MTHSKTTIALISSEPISKNMAGTAIRYFNLAQVLASDFKVSLFSPQKSDVDIPNVEIINFKTLSLSLLSDFDYVITQNLDPMLVYKLKKAGVKIIFDLYAPDIIEAKELFKDETKSKQKSIYNFKLNELRAKLSLADHILCASERQIEYYSKANSYSTTLKLRGTSKLTANSYTLLPFGISDQAIDNSKSDILYKKFPSLKKSQKIILWGGGIWNWFDPLSVIKAIDMIAKERNDVALIFMGIKHPNPKIPQMKMTADALKLANDLKLFDKFVFFNFGWTPYGERVDYLSQAYLGISTAFDIKENYYSFRTRDLDYFWADLPTISTSGDVLSELIRKDNLGIIVNFRDPVSIKNAVIDLMNDKIKYDDITKNIRRIKPNFYWKTLVSEFSNKIINDKIKSKPTSLRQCLAFKSKHYLLGAKKKYL